MSKIVLLTDPAGAPAPAEGIDTQLPSPPEAGTTGVDADLVRSAAGEFQARFGQAPAGQTPPPSTPLGVEALLVEPDPKPKTSVFTLTNPEIVRFIPFEFEEENNNQGLWILNFSGIHLFCYRRGNNHFTGLIIPNRHDSLMDYLSGLGAI